MKGFFDVKKTQNLCAVCKSKGKKIEPVGNFKKEILVLNDKKGRGVRLLEAYLQDVGIDLYEDCIVSHVVQCQVKTITNTDITNCQQNVISEIKKYKPKIVILLGAMAVKSVIGYNHKKALGGVDKWRGWIIPDQDLQCFVAPIYHPTYLGERKGFKEVETIFKNDLKRISETLQKDFPDYSDLQQGCEIIYDEQQAVKELKRIQKRVKKIAIDYETTGIKPHAEGHYISMMAIAVSGERSICIYDPGRPVILKEIKKVLTAPDIAKIAQNMKFEHIWTKEIFGFEVVNWYWDTMLASHVLDNRDGVTGLKFQTYAHFGIPDYDSHISKYLKSKDGKANGINSMSYVENTPKLLDDMMLYCAMDALLTFKLSDLQNVEITFSKHNLLTGYNLLHQGVLALARAEMQGIHVDVDYIEKVQKQLEKKISRMEEKFRNSDFAQLWKEHFRGRVNFNSSDQLRTVLYEVKGLTPPKTTASGKGSTDEESLKALNLPELQMIIDVKKLKKLGETYLQNFYQEQINGVMHPNFNLHNVVTYRSSSSNPNFQNIPKKDAQAMKITRKSIKARPGHQLLEVDFSKLEVSIAACYHKDPEMLKYLTGEKNDMHGDLAQQIFMVDDFDKHRKDHAWLRSATKNCFIFPQFYGDYYKNNAQGFCKELNLDKHWTDADGVELDGAPIGKHLRKHKIRNLKQFENHLADIESDFWNKRFALYGKWKEKWGKKYQKTAQFPVLTGFVCKGEFKKNQVINYPVQGAAFHCLLWTFIELDKIMRQESWKTRLVGQIHDAIVLDVHPDELEHVSKTIKKVAEVELPKAFDWIIVPLQIEAELCPVDGNWSEKEDWEEFNNFLKNKPISKV
jgi:DNA polymerase-1